MYHTVHCCCMHVSYPFRGSVTYFIALFLTVVLGFSFSCFKSAELYWVSAHFISGKLHLWIFRWGSLHTTFFSPILSGFVRTFENEWNFFRLNQTMSLSFEYLQIWLPKQKIYTFLNEISNLKKNGILFPKLFWPTVRKNCSSDWEKLLKFEAEN